MLGVFRLVVLGLVGVASAASGQVETRPIERLDGEVLSMDVGLLLVEAGGASRFVSSRHRFSAGDRFALRVRANRGGYLSIAVPVRESDGDCAGDDDCAAESSDLAAECVTRHGDRRLRQIWPERCGAHPLAAARTTRIPTLDQPEFELMASEAGSTELFLLFTPEPARWREGWRELRQIRLRDVSMSEASEPAEFQGVRFEDRLANGERGAMRLRLNRREAR